MRRALAIAAGLFAALAILPASSSLAQQSLYTVKQKVSATAADAVKAKAEAMEQGRKDAARALFKRLAPLSAYDRLPELELSQINPMLDSVSVRDERNSTTAYYATLGFAFVPSVVRETLLAHGITAIDRQAPPIHVLPVVIADGAVKPQSREGWADAWESLDLAGSLAPVFLTKPPDDLTPDRLTAILGGDGGAYDALKKRLGVEKLVLAVGSPLTGGERFGTRLYGADAVGAIDLSRTDRIFGVDVEDAAQRAALVAKRIIETRWKIEQGGGSAEPMPWADNGMGRDRGNGVAGYDPNSGAAYAAPLPAPEPAEREGSGGFLSNLFGFGSEEEPPEQPQQQQQRYVMTVQFAGLQQWQVIRSELVVVPGVEALEIGSLSARSAQITFNYSGNIGSLRQNLAARGLDLRGGGGGLVLVQN